MESQESQVEDAVFVGGKEHGKGGLPQLRWSLWSPPLLLQRPQPILLAHYVQHVVVQAIPKQLAS